MDIENYDLCFPDQPVVDLYLPIWASLPAFRHKPAFIWAEDDGRVSTLTYGHLNSAVDSISSHLSLSLKRRDTIVILCQPGLELIEVIFACQRAGLLAVPVTPPQLRDNNDSHLFRVLSQTKPKAAIATNSYINSVRKYTSSNNNALSEHLQTLEWVSIEEVRGPITEVDNLKQKTPPYKGCSAADVYLIQYTSGATGIPKPVLVTAGAAAHNVRVARKSYDLHPNSVIVSWLPQYHDCGLMFLLLTIVSGATSVLTSPTAFIKRPRLWLEMMTEYKATCTPVPSFVLPLVVRRRGAGTSRINLASMKNLIIINEPIYKASVDEFLCFFQPFGLNPSSISPSYGLAENCTFVSTSWRSGNHNFPFHMNLLPSAKLPCSKQEILEEEIEILIVNEETHEPVEDGVEGEIWISSPSNASGYLHHPSLTREVFAGRLRNRVGGCFVRTGDRGTVIGQDRYLYVTGRCSDIIKKSDREIHPHYIETAAYNSCPSLIRPGCLAAFELSGSVTVVAELQKGEVDTKQLMKICEGIKDAIWNDERVEVGVVILVGSRSVPKTTSGKVRRWAAKYAVERGRMDEVMRMEFGCNSMVFGAAKEEREDKKIEGAEERERVLLADTNTGSRVSIQSSL